jgi:hypothetical protein
LDFLTEFAQPLCLVIERRVLPPCPSGIDKLAFDASTARYTALAPDRFKDFWKD